MGTKGGEEEVESDPTLRNENNKRKRRKMAVIAQIWTIILQVSVLVSISIIPMFSIVLLYAMEWLLPTVPVVTFSPVGVVLAGSGVENGVRITRVVMLSAAVVAAKRLYYLNTNGYPTVELEPSQSESKIEPEPEVETND